MNICFVLFSFTQGGIGRVTSIVANELNKKENINCYALGYTDVDDVGKSYMTTFPVLYANHTNLSMKNAILKEHYTKKVKRYIKENNIDIIISCGAMFYPVSVLIAKICHIKVICWDHVAPHVTWDYKYEKEAREFGARFSDCNLLLTKQAQDIFNKRYPKKNNCQIYNPIDSGLMKKELYYNVSGKKIISVGRLCYQKDFKRLLMIADGFLNRYPDWTWDIYGDGPEKEDLKQIIYENGLEKQVFLCGQVADLYDRYREYSFIVMTSRYEGFPMTLLEAMANGLPAVAFDILTGPGEIIENNVNGFLCSYDNDKEMIEKIEILMRDQSIRMEMSAECRSSVKKFQLDTICKQWLDLLRSLTY